MRMSGLCSFRDSCFTEGRMASDSHRKEVVKHVQISRRTICRKGTYWNLSNGERIDAHRTTALPGGEDTHYMKLRSPACSSRGRSQACCSPASSRSCSCSSPCCSCPAPCTLPRRSSRKRPRPCLGCHATPGMSTTFRDKSTLSVHVSESHFQNTVHGFLACTGCHSDVSLDTHPPRSTRVNGNSCSMSLKRASHAMPMNS